MSGTYLMKLEKEQSIVCAVSDDLITQSPLSENYLSGGCESESVMKCEVKEFTYGKSTACDVTATLKHFTDSSDQLTDKSEDVEQEKSLESKSTLTVPSSSQLCTAECSSTSSQSCAQTEPDRQVICQHSDVPVLMDVKEEDESDSEISDADSFVKEQTDSERETLQSSLTCSPEEQCLISSIKVLDNTAQSNRCPACQIIFSEFEYLKKHIENKHVNEGRHQCNQCEKVYRRVSDLSKHIKRIHEGMNGSRQSSNNSAGSDMCSQCEKTFSGTDQVKQCIQCKHLSDSQFHCTQCDKVFSKDRYLKQHIQHKHVNNRLHCCTQCDKSYNVKSDLTQHIKHVHGDKKYECDKCDYSSMYSQNLKKHISAVHLLEKPHKCSQCDAYFSQKSYLMQHIRFVHKPCALR